MQLPLDRTFSSSPTGPKTCISARRSRTAAILAAHALATIAALKVRPARPTLCSGTPLLHEGATPSGCVLHTQKAFGVTVLGTSTTSTSDRHIAEGRSDIVIERRSDATWRRQPSIDCVHLTAHSHPPHHHRHRRG